MSLKIKFSIPIKIKVSVEIIREPKLKPIKKKGQVIGVRLPIVNKNLYFDKIIEKKSQVYAKFQKRNPDLYNSLPTKEDLKVLQRFREQISALYPRFKELNIWSNTLDKPNYFNSYWSLTKSGEIKPSFRSYKYAFVPLYSD